MNSCLLFIYNKENKTKEIIIEIEKLSDINILIMMKKN